MRVAKSLATVIGVVAVVAFARPSAASTLTLDFATQFSNGTLPGGPAPWMRAVFDDAAVGMTPGADVRLTITTIGLSGSEFITETGFSLNPALGNSAVLIQAFTVINNAGGSWDSAVFGLDQFQADGDGKYDININFSSNPPRFGAGMTFVADMTFTGAVTAADFNFLATPGGANGPFFAAAHLQGIGAAGALSTWIADSTPPVFVNPLGNPAAVPEPASLALLGSGLLLIGSKVRHRLKNRS